MRLWMRFYGMCSTHMYVMKISCLEVYITLFAPHIWALSFEKAAKIFYPHPLWPFILLCQTVEVINPSIMITTDVVLCNNINKSLSDSYVLSIVVTYGVHIAAWGLIYLLPKEDDVNGQVGGVKTFPKLGYKLPKWQIFIVYTVGHKDGIFFPSTIPCNISCCGRYLGCLAFYHYNAESTSLFLTYSHKIRQHSPSTRCVLSLKWKGATGTAELRILSHFICLNQFLKYFVFWWFYCILMFNCTVSNATLSPFIYVLGTKPWQNVLGTCSRYTSVHITSTVKCSRYRFVQICNRHNSRAAQYDVLCIHCATCEVILMCTLRADSGLRAKPRPLSTLFSVP